MSESAADIDPRTSALLVMDFQPAILGLLDDADAPLAGAEAAIALARDGAMRLIHVRVAFTPADHRAVPPRNKIFGPMAAGGDLRDGAPEAEIHSQVAPQEGEVVIRKTRVGAFSTTDLDELLVASGVETIVLAGVTTGGVVLSTVRDAADRDYRVLVLTDASADPDPDLHRILTERVFPQQADVVDVATFERSLHRARREAPSSTISDSPC